VQRPSQALQIVSFGGGVMIACSEQHFKWAEKTLAMLDPEDVFTPRWLEATRVMIENEQPGWELSPPALRFLCATEIMSTEPANQGLSVRLMKPSDLPELERYRPLLPNALSNNSGSSDQVIAAVFEGGALVAASGASSDAPGMWQVGVDTLIESRRHGAGRLAVWHLTRYVLQQNVAPFYSTHFGNLASQRLARSVGYWPCWLETYARQRLPEST
jgi:hypothetical protein